MWYVLFVIITFVIVKFVIITATFSWGTYATISWSTYATFSWGTLFILNQHRVSSPTFGVFDRLLTPYNTADSIASSYVHQRNHT